MKKALSLLLAFMFLQTQMWALSGGPVFTSTGTVTDLTGVYAGVLVGKSIVAAAGFPIPALTTGSVGVFSITVPIAGAATGTTVIFQGNVAYSGTIIGAANPANRSITGLIQVTSTSQFTVTPAIPAVPAGPSTVNISPPLFIPIVVPGSAAIPAQAAVTTPLFAQGTLEAQVTRTSVTSNTGNQAVNGVLRSSGTGAGGVDANGTPATLGSVGDRLSGKATIVALFQDTSVVGPPSTANLQEYSISGIRQTNVIATAVTATP